MSLPALPPRRALVDAYDPGSNNFNLLRFVLALLVLWSHSYSLAGMKDPLARMSGQLEGGGLLGVEGFFVVSGFLVTQSWQRSRTVVAYVRKRVLRLFPALLASLVFSVFVVGPMGSSRSWMAYLQDPRPWCAFLGVFLHRFSFIPEVFPDNPFPGHVNGSLWTLRYEMVCYVLIALIGFLPAALRRAATCGLFALAWGAARVSPDKGFFGDTSYWLPHLVSYFAAGMCLQEFAAWVPYSRVAVGVAGLALAGGLAIGHLAPVLPIAGSYLVLAAAVAPCQAAARFGRRGDVSYGLYVYAYPIQQLLLHLAGGTLDPRLLFAASFPATLGLAMLSWRFVEAPALAYKGQ